MVLAAAPALAQYPYVIVGGYARFHKPYDQYSFAPINTTKVKFCVDDWTGSGARGEGECYTSQTGTNLSRGTAYYQINLSPNKIYYFFLWDDSQDWGSRTVPAWLVQSNGVISHRILVPGSFPADLDIYQEPRPHKPQAVYPPNGSTNIPMAFTLKWSSGIDTLRQWPSVWSVKYDIYAYGAGGSELKVLSDIPCYPEGNNCTYYINNVVPNWLYYWRVVAKLQVTPGGRILETSSDTFTFTTQP
jgi:hypothetical protein